MIFVKTIVWLKTDTLPTENTEEEPCGQEAAVCRYFFSKMVYNNRQELIHLISFFLSDLIWSADWLDRFLPLLKMLEECVHS